MPETKRNPLFNCLKVILIIMVIDDHVNARIGFLSSIFPYNSFYMPLFVFISGYFYRQRGIVDGLFHKIRKILLPYLIWNIVGFLIAWVLHKAGIVHWCGPWETVITRTFFSGAASSIVGSGWFALMLFQVSVVYSILDNLIPLPRAKGRNYALLGILCAAAMAGIWVCMHRFSEYAALIARTLFYLQFYHMGHMFSKYWEDTVQGWNKGVVCALCVACNVVLICLYSWKISFISTSNMGHFHSWWLPLITSVTGGLFWYEIAAVLSSAVRENRLVDLVARNTFTIMMTHLMFLNIPNFFVYRQIMNGSTKYGDFDIAAFQSSAWYRYSSRTLFVAFFMGLIGSFIVIIVLTKSKEVLRKRRGQSAA